MRHSPSPHRQRRIPREDIFAHPHDETISTLDHLDVLAEHYSMSGGRTYEIASVESDPQDMLHSIWQFIGARHRGRNKSVITVATYISDNGGDVSGTSIHRGKDVSVVCAWVA